MTAAVLATAQRKALRWFERMKNCVVDQGNGQIVKVVALCRKDGGVNELGIWFDDERGSTHLRDWVIVEQDLAP